MDSTFIGTLTGGIYMPVLLAFIVAAYFAALISMFIEFLSRKPLSPTSPKKPSFKYWWSDNWARFAGGLLLIPLVIVAFKFFTGNDPQLGWMFVLGLGVDRIMELIKRKGFFPNADNNN